VNYEDRTDLLPPSEVISAALLSQLRRTPDAVALISVAAADPASTAVTPAAHEAIVRRAYEDTGPGSGAPERARAIEEDAMLCGYRFGRLAVRPTPGSWRPTAAQLRERADSMYLYDLFLEDSPTLGRGAPVADILGRHEGDHDSALDEAVCWAWFFGLGVALIEADS
jgi:hypothetical protein